jgi:hypothetical protein
MLHNIAGIDSRSRLFSAPADPRLSDHAPTIGQSC